MKQVVQITDPNHKWCGALGTIEQYTDHSSFLIGFRVLKEDSAHMAYAALKRNQLVGYALDPSWAMSSQVWALSGKGEKNDTNNHD